MFDSKFISSQYLFDGEGFCTQVPKVTGKQWCGSNGTAARRVSVDNTSTLSPVNGFRSRVGNVLEM